MIKKAGVFSACMVALLLPAGCQKGGNMVKDSESGFSMRLPAGWRTFEDNETAYYDPAKRDDNWGRVYVEPLGGRTLDQYVENSMKQLMGMESMQKGMMRLLEKVVPGVEEGTIEVPSTRIISNTPRTAGGREAVEVISESEYMVMEVFIRKDEQVIAVSFRALKDDFQKLEPSFRASIDSIKIK